MTGQGVARAVQAGVQSDLFMVLSSVREKLAMTQSDQPSTSDDLVSSPELSSGDGLASREDPLSRVELARDLVGCFHSAREALAQLGGQSERLGAGGGVARLKLLDAITGEALRLAEAVLKKEQADAGPSEDPPQRPPMVTTETIRESVQTMDGKS